MLISLYGLIQAHVTKAFKPYYSKELPERIEKLKNVKTKGQDEYIKSCLQFSQHQDKLEEKYTLAACEYVELEPSIFFNSLKATISEPTMKDALQKSTE